MAKFNLAYVRSHPVMFGAIFVVFGLGLWLLLNRGSGSSGGGVTTYNSGPSDAQVSAGVTQNLATIAANRDLALAQLSLQGQAAQIDGQRQVAAMEMQYQIAGLQSQHDLGEQTIAASLAALTAQLSTQKEINADNNAFQIAFARSAQDAANTSLMINASLQRDLSKDQLEAFKTSSIIGALGQVKKKDRDNVLIDVFGNPANVASDYAARTAANSGGGGLFSGALKIVSPVMGAISG